MAFAAMNKLLSTQNMKYDIEFPNPFWIGIKITESEDKLPSLGCEVDLKLELPRGCFSYSASEMWFECLVLDDFLAQLKKLRSGESSKAEFYDMDREFLLTITNDEVRVSVQRIHSEIGSSYLEFKRDYDSDMTVQYIEHIESFAKWW